MMKLPRLGLEGSERPAVCGGDDCVVGVSSVTEDFDRAFLAGRGTSRLACPIASGPPTGSGGNRRVGPPISGPGKIIGIGVNYADHAAETEAELPTESIVFRTTPNTVVGPNDEVLIPVGGTRSDWEVEFGVAVGRTARYRPDVVSAEASIAGYVVPHDVSGHDFQLERGGQWAKRKSSETFKILGPRWVTPDLVSDHRSLDISLEVNGEQVQESSTIQMIFGAAELVRYPSQYVILEPSDINSGTTPASIGLGMRPPCHLQPGDEVPLSISGLGMQRRRFRRAQTSGQPVATAAGVSP